MPRRLVQLFAGLILYGVSDSMLLLAGLGVDPWDVLHQGLARRTGIPTGTWAIIAGAVLEADVPLVRLEPDQRHIDPTGHRPGATRS
jgi:uncharacterized membrane protein YczE